jgi:hypothetical protein
MTLVTVIGRGHSGTRAISHTLIASGVFMGGLLNRSGDLLPPQEMYDACRVLARSVELTEGDSISGDTWNFDRLHEMEIPSEFTDLLHSYLKDVLAEEERYPHRLSGWKIPETTLIYPWLVRLYPDIKYIFWIRDPRDSIINQHKTDDLADFGIPYHHTDDVRTRRALSWKYQYDIVKATPRPKNWIEVRFEDFVLDQEATLRRLEEYLGIPLARIITRPDSVGRWRSDEGRHSFDFFRPAMEQYGYELSSGELSG